MKYQAVLFDMDGTVLDTLRDLNAAVNRALAEFGHPQQSLDETRRRVGNGSRRLLELSVPEGTDNAQIDRILAWYLPYYNAHSNDATRPYEGIPELMEALKDEGIPLAVVSNKPDRTVKELSAIHFPGLLEVSVGENEAGGVRRKPWPDTLFAAASALGVEAGDCLYVGDSEVDVLTAARAGMDCASVLWGFRSREELTDAGAKLFFETPGALQNFLLDTGI
ncbi:MAG: HAD family hydrolase [Oscillospiraceae bacterium]|nr:HAD family hydrolase [Oscillospiraceae bacterium]